MFHLLELVQQWSALGRGKGSKELWNTVLFAVLWVVWTARNENIFQGKNIRFEAMVEKVKNTAASWLFVHYPTEVPTQFFINENFALISAPKKVTRETRGAAWQPPPVGWWKINVDGSALGKPGPAGIGAVIRDSTGETILVISRYIGEADYSYAELMAVHEILFVLVHGHGFPLPRTIIESDSSVVVSWLTGGTRYPWYYDRELLVTKGMLSMIGGLSIHHIHRERNAFADSMAKRGARREPDLLEWS